MKTASKIYIYALCDLRDLTTYYYIGQTSQRISSRVNKHIEGAKGKSRDCNKEKHLWILGLLQENLKPVGKVLYVCNSGEEADDLEQSFINLYSGEHPLLNVASGGTRDSSFSLSEESRKKISIYARRRTEIHKQNNRNARRGIKFTEEQKKRLSEAHLKGKRSIPVRKKIGQYDMEGNLIAVFKNIQEAIQKTGIPRGAIQSCIHGRALSGYGYKWSFIN